MNQGKPTHKNAAQVGEREIVITRVFDAPREIVFDAWTKEEHLSVVGTPRFYDDFSEF